MPFGSLTLSPGVNVQRTPMLLRAGLSSSNLIRFKDSLVQKYGGWQLYYGSPLNGIPRDIHVWQDLNNNKWLSIGTTKALDVLTNNIITDIPILTDITPKTLTSNCIPNILTSATSTTVIINDPNISGVTQFDSVFFNVPVSVGGIILDGLYPITGGSGSEYTITVPSPATITNNFQTSAATAATGTTLHFSATPPSELVPSWVIDNLFVVNNTTPSVIPSGTVSTGSITTTAVPISNAVTGGGVAMGDSIAFSSIPIFTTVSGSSAVSVFLNNHGLSVGDVVVFPLATTVGGVTIQGTYDVIVYTDSNNFKISASNLATSSTSTQMNSGQLQLIYYITLGPVPSSHGYSVNGYSSGGYGSGGSGGSQQDGNEISAIDWTLDNWGSILTACPKNGGLYYWDPAGGLANASIIPEAPPFNTGQFVSMSEQIMIAFGSSVHEGIGWQQQPLLVQWSDAQNFFQWTASAATQAGNFVLSPGSMIVAGLAGSNQNLLWTDLDLWAMNYIGPPLVFGFNKIGAGMGAVSMHSIQQLRGSVFWMGKTNFYAYTGAGANVVPCPVWDAVFQNLNTNYLQNIRAMPNTPFNEVGWLYPSLASQSGECDSYVKFNISEPGTPWDIGPMPRSTWIDQTVLGNPIATSSSGYIYQHEMTPDAGDVAMNSSMTTGYFYLAESEEFVFIDQVIPDFKWNTYTGSTSAQIQMSFSVLNYPSDTPTIYGPYVVTNQTEYISVRFRGRLVSITIQSDDFGSFWRIGSIKFRYSPAGRR